jgi:hypothetical protein
MPAARRVERCPPSPGRFVFASWQTRWRRLSPLAREVTLILLIKAAALTLIWLAFFRAPAAPRMQMDPQQVERALLVPAPATEPVHADR